ncbi:TPA: lipase, partial [Campylobacter coli]|nr:lipase [Campylobacter coli]HEF9402814.1 lipase [Campylobacter coli]
MQYDDLHYEFQYIGKDCDDILEEDILEESFFNLRNQDKNFFVKPLSLGVIQSLTKDSPLHLLRALYACKPFAICNENNESFITQENAARILGYKSAFYLSFIAHKDSLSNEYLQARKSLYKTIMNLREQREQDYKEEQERISQLSYEEYQREREKTLREQQRQERMQRARNPNTTNHLILETKDKNNVVIFLDSDISLSNLIHIHNNKIDIFTKDGTILDIQRLETLLQEYININHNTDNNTNNNDNNTAITLDLLNSPNTQIFLYSQLLLGGSESPISSQEYFFGLLDSKNSDTLLDTLKPIYYFAPKDESSGLGKLSIFYHSSTLTLLNYSIIDSSLNIKLECTSKESQKLLSNALSLKEKEYQSKTIQAQQSIATLHSLLENQEVKCIHGGKVILKSNKGKTFKSDGIPLILESDLLGSKISGCPRSVGGVSDPCTQVVNVKASLSQKKINGEYAILQELIGGCLSDKGFPLEVSFVPSKIKFDHSYDPKIGLTKQSLTTSQSFNLPILRLYYKEHNYQIDNTLIQRYTLNNTLYELKEES